MADLKPEEIEDAEMAFMVYGSGGELDSTNLGLTLYAMNLNPSLDTLQKFGAAEKPGQKVFKFDEFLPIFSQCKKDKKEQGCYEDFVECLKLYDKNENGKMLAAELSHSLLSLGERLTDVQVDELFEDCLDEEDDEGQIDYDPFLKRMCDKMPPFKPQKKK